MNLSAMIEFFYINKLDPAEVLQKKRTAIKFIIVAAVFILSGCAAVGPPTVARDRFDYVNAISDSWKRQMLLNLTKIRYMDALVFLDVSSIISQYSLEGEISLGVSWSDPVLGDSQTVGGTGRYADRPTITYSPLTGERFTRSLMTPIPVAAILSLLQSGYPVDFVFRIAVQTINGIDNRFGGEIMQRSGDPAFYQLLRLLRKIQKADGLGMRIKAIDDKETLVMFFSTSPDEILSREMSEVRQILGISKETGEFKVVFGSVAADDREIALQTRSMLQIIIELASYIDVPPEDVAEGRVYEPPKENIPDFVDLINIRSGLERPTNAYVAVRYRNLWFWIDDRDLNSKRMFGFVMLLFSLTETGGREGAPIVTVPTN